MKKRRFLMGMMVDGEWSTQWYKPDEKGRFMREKTRFHSRVTADGSSGHKAESGRYHLYVSLACPWAHRTLIMRKLKGLEGAISLSVVNHFMGDDGWSFAEDKGVIADPIHNAQFLREIYAKADPKYTGRVTVPVLWDKQKETIVSNESREILRMLDVEFDAVAAHPEKRYYFSELDCDIEDTIDAIYEPINNGVYRSGFATKQEAYDEAVGTLFKHLERWEEILGRQRYMVGDRITEADWCLFTTLYRFDAVYYVHFKCNVRRIVDYPNLWNYVKELYQIPGVSETCNMHHIKHHYYRSHPMVNPTRIVPLGPLLNFDEPHDRDRFA
jgi:glutathionyl-hydroquinone reductase